MVGISILPTPFELWASSTGYDTAPTVLPAGNRVYADSRTQEAYEALAGRSIERSPDVDGFDHRHRGVAGEDTRTGGVGMNRLLQNRACNEQGSGQKGEPRFDVHHPSAGVFNFPCKGPRRISGRELRVFLLPPNTIRLTICHSFPQQIAEKSCADDVHGKGEDHHHQRPLRPRVIEDPLQRTEHHPVGGDNGVAHLKARFGELSAPILKLAGDFLERFPWGLVKRVIACVRLFGRLLFWHSVSPLMSRPRPLLPCRCFLGSLLDWRFPRNLFGSLFGGFFRSRFLCHSLFLPRTHFVTNYWGWTLSLVVGLRVPGRDAAPSPQIRSARLPRFACAAGSPRPHIAAAHRPALWHSPTP